MGGCLKGQPLTSELVSGRTRGEVLSWRVVSRLFPYWHRWRSLVGRHAAPADPSWCV